MTNDIRNTSDESRQYRKPHTKVAEVMIQNTPCQSEPVLVGHIRGTAMRHSFRTLIIAMASMLAMASCTERLPENVKDDPQDIKTFLKINSVSTSEHMKSAIEDNRFPTAETASIGLFVGKTKGKEFSKPADSDNWTDPQIELPTERTTLYGYYPYQAGITVVGSIPVSSSVDGADFMWATPVDGVCTSNPEVDLSMNHALALVEVTFNVTGYAEGAKMSALTLTAGSFAQEGTLDAADGSIAAGTAAAGGCQLLADKQTLTLKDGVIVAKCLLVPTGLDGRQDMTIACTLDGKNLKASLSADKGVFVKSGTKSTVSLDINCTMMEVSEVGISDWDLGDASVTVGGAGGDVSGDVPSGT